MSQNIPLACDMNAIPADERDAHVETAKNLFASVMEVKPSDDGYFLRLPVETASLLEATKFIANERLCCPFFKFSLTMEPGSTALWLYVGGGEDIKAFAQEEILAFLPDHAAEAASL
jgi:hypothetical protein